MLTFFLFSQGNKNINIEKLYREYRDKNSAFLSALCYGIKSVIFVQQFNLIQ